MERKMSDGQKSLIDSTRKDQKDFEGNRVLRQIFQELERDEAKFEFLAYMQHHYSLPGEYIERTIAYYKKQKPSTAAYYSYLDNQDENVYIDLFDMRSEQQIKKDAVQERRIEEKLKEVGRTFKPLTEEEKARSGHNYTIDELSIDEAIEMIDIYERRESGWGSKKAAELALDAGLIEEAIRINERREWFKEAGEIAESEGMLERALEEYELAKEYDFNIHVMAGQVAVKIANKKRDARKGFFSIGSRKYNAEEKKYLEKAVNHFVQDSNWNDTAVELAEQILSVEQQVKVYLECHGPYEAITYAAEKKAYTAALEICEDHGFYDVGLGIATKVGNKKKAVLYGKILALREHGDDVDDLERAIEKVKNRSEKETMNYVQSRLSIDSSEETQDPRTEQAYRENERVRSGISNGLAYAKRVTYEIRDAFLAEGAFEAIKTLCGVDTTSQLVKKAAAVVLTATGLSSPYAAYHMYSTLQQPETSQVVAEAPKLEYAQIQEVNPTTQTMQYTIKEVKTMRRGCSH